jgi:hypothetical protein
MEKEYELLLLFNGISPFPEGLKPGAELKGAWLKLETTPEKFSVRFEFTR